LGVCLNSEGHGGNIFGAQSTGKKGTLKKGKRSRSKTPRLATLGTGSSLRGGFLKVKGLLSEGVTIRDHESGRKRGKRTKGRSVNPLSNIFKKDSLATPSIFKKTFRGTRGSRRTSSGIIQQKVAYDEDSLGRTK